jgi:hypothetical protein
VTAGWAGTPGDGEGVGVCADAADDVRPTGSRTATATVAEAARRREPCKRSMVILSRGDPTLDRAIYG